MRKAEVEALVDEAMATMLGRPARGENHHIVGYVAQAGPSNWFGSIVEVGDEEPYDQPKTVDFKGARALACTIIAGLLSPRNVGQVFSATGLLRVVHVATKTETFFQGDDE